MPDIQNLPLDLTPCLSKKEFDNGNTPNDGDSDPNEGFSYEHMAISLVFLRCLRKQLPSFELRSEYDAAGKFDDVVVEWKCTRNDGSVGRYKLLVQLKHKTSPDFQELKEAHFFSSTYAEKGFNIEKYYESFKEIKGSLNGRQYALVLSTNASLHENARCFFREPEASSVVGEADLLETGGEASSVVGEADLLQTGGVVYQLNPDNERT
ncbi:uncharacterized protein LOC126209820 [Schistocerca nitens]|uniref:uncharacterized protein LOC126209820 n=1 Tax=Schistocerca nitens TaxID=7011 RepID=UPI0021191F13|nr:uncharacterized protein LOC126209820 [Schistocerca nitens]